LNTGYILSKDEVILASESEKNSITNIKLNKEKNGLDDKGNPIFYDDKESKAKEIFLVLSKKYKYKIFDKDGVTNLRDDSFNSAYISGTIKSGEYIDIIDNTNQEWLYVKTKDNREGYIHKSRIVSE
ncbi:SH3 domain-containing protein, partial [Flavobacterium psychrophilum]|nr:SH3 domain-containing protein [Flavobacterium psychrophilum]